VNLELLNDIIISFEDLVVNNGFNRDLADSINSMGANQNNIVNLRSIADKIEKHLNSIYSSELPDSLLLLFPPKTNTPFTNEKHLEKIQSLINNTTINVTQFFTELSNLLSKLNSQLQNNIGQCNNIKNFIMPYINISSEISAKENNAILAIIYKDKKIIKNLNEFSKILSKFQRTINLYHQILKSTSPGDIEILEVQNGSIDIIINLDLNIALDLVELFKIGFKCYLAYLSYKKILRPIVETYLGNKKLEASEAEREKNLLENIGDAIKNKIREQHKKAIVTDQHIDKNIDKKVEQVSRLVTSHIINGNDIKLLSIPESDNKNTQNETFDELRILKSNINFEIKKIPEQDLIKLLEYYNNDDENNEKQ